MSYAEALRALIQATDGHKEKECQPFLDLALPLLLVATPDQIITYGREEPSRAGSSDFIISAVFGSGAAARRDALVWEVKSPQTFLFEPDDSKQRMRPTKELVKAETQLGYYVEELRTSSSFRDKYGLDSYSSVIPAGIIIGRSSALSKPDPVLQSQDQRHLEKTALHIRNRLVYDRAGLRIHTWDEVLRWLEVDERKAA